MVQQPELTKTVFLVLFYHFEKLAQVLQSVMPPGHSGVVICCVLSLAPLHLCGVLFMCILFGKPSHGLVIYACAE